MNERGRPPERPATNPITGPESSSSAGSSWARCESCGDRFPALVYLERPGGRTARRLRPTAARGAGPVRAPAEQRVDMSELLDELDQLLSRYVAFPNPECRHAVVLWVLHCHALDAFESTPRLALLSPEKGSGKTRTLEVLSLVVPTPMHAVNMSAAALYRVVADRQPTLLLDEADTYLGTMVAKQHEDIRGLINAGHRRGAMTYRGEVSGKAVRVVEFPAFAACALAGIGDLPDTILDRSVIVAMKRRAPNEHVEAFRERLARPQADELRERLAAWAARHLAALEDAWPIMPETIIDRAADVWEPLVAIADAAGGDWPERARHSAVTLNNARAERDPSLGVQLLADCRRLFTATNSDRLTTEALVDALINLDESPWGDLRGKSLDARGLARRLKKYDVRPGNHRFPEGILRGYRLEDMHDAWQRYLPSVVDVVDVVENQRETGVDGDVVDSEANEVGDLLSNRENGSLSVSTEALHPLQAQLTENSET